VSTPYFKDDSGPRVSPMALRRDELASDGLRRIALEQMDLALWHVQRLGEADVHVHEVRKATKRVRALLRLVRDELGDEAYGLTNTIVRDVARKLSRVRSSSVQVQILGELTRENARLVDSTEALFDELSADVVRSRRAMGEVAFIDDMTSRLETARTGIVGWALARDLNPISHGLRRTYRRGRSGMARAYTEGTSVAFHRWRKQVKYLRHQLEVLTPISQERLSVLVVGLEAIGTALGLDHDLADLEVAASGSVSAAGSRACRGELIDIIERRRGDLRIDLHPLALELYDQTPPTFGGEMTDLWQRWRDAGSAQRGVSVGR